MTGARRTVPWRFQWAGLAYLLLVFGVAVFVYLVTWGPFFDPAGGASFAGIWLFLVALPSSLIIFSLPPSLIDLPAFGVLVAACLAQAGAVYALCRWLDWLLFRDRDRVE